MTGHLSVHSHLLVTHWRSDMHCRWRQYTRINEHPPGRNKQAQKKRSCTLPVNRFLLSAPLSGWVSFRSRWWFIDCRFEGISALIVPILSVTQSYDRRLLTWAPDVFDTNDVISETIRQDTKTQYAFNAQKLMNRQPCLSRITKQKKGKTRKI